MTVCQIYHRLSYQIFGTNSKEQTSVLLSDIIKCCQHSRWTTVVLAHLTVISPTCLLVSNHWQADINTYFVIWNNWLNNFRTFFGSWVHDRKEPPRNYMELSSFVMKFLASSSIIRSSSYVKFRLQYRACYIPTSSNSIMIYNKTWNECRNLLNIILANWLVWLYLKPLIWKQ